MEPNRILVVDDDPVIRSVLVEILHMHAFEVTECESAVSVHRLAIQDMPDVIVLDVHMPGKDGITLIQELRRDPNTMSIPVIILTADVSESMLYRGFESGINDFITKPFRTNELILRIKALIRARETLHHQFRMRHMPTHSYLSQDEQFIARLSAVVDTLLQSGMAGDVTTHDAAKRIGVSPATLQRRVRRIFGTSFGQWLLENRLDRARALLVQGSTSMARIALETGFTNPSYFSYVFKRRYGIPPRLYREQYRNLGNVAEG